jgi:hypothetical protein
LKLGPTTAVVSTAVLGGQLVEADPSNVGFVRPASAASVTVIGVAAGDAQPAGSNPTNPLNVSWAHSEVGVQYGPADVDVTYAANATYGQQLIAAANGTVTPGVTAGQVVGRCTAPTGVLSGNVGPMRLSF